ncbi:MAG: Rrf2 family transcriptional regulator [Rhodospirillaceae bacterium]|jgi:Rrf2 family protein|nr:Rrf2 family transcriptional regulator [Rhodospirillales bacterium]MBT3907730.1 Rrf2 family transcriptional regulator [Rhodospirillaceae bacterium]MBT4700089.1 Rrf2 family transcriptional regulator [Rhodospirillaceae bacterium]MBT5035182.1 Rrf2 family transcriptional regulator [Rhodospirillaceae bacterium]MBT6220153.1 Rrf2 family transcriptional regulator [Rhodospirillaceae bacterium]
MLRLSKKMLFAIEAVLDIAYHSASEPVQSHQITKRQGIPRRYLEQALQHLVRDNILVGVRGPRGGYRLARERRRISVADIVRVVQVMEKNENKDDELLESDLGRKVVQPLWLELQVEMTARLENLSIDDLCTRAKDEGVVSEGQRNLDFII